MLNRELVKAGQHLFKQIRKLSLAATRDREQTVWLLRAMLINGRQAGLAQGGFVLPTVAMVILVVILLTTAILFRSFDRSKNASNVRVSETILNAATPALDRAKAKLDALFKDPRLPRSTPSDFALYQVLKNNLNEFTFGDETQLKLVSDFNSGGGIVSDPDLEQDETLLTAWKFPVDTDNNGSYDTFTLYGIYFRNPSTNRQRSPLEARTPPMDEGAISNQCNSTVATSANLVGSAGWYRIGSTLKKSIFVYTATVPITNTTGLPTTRVGNRLPYEQYKGNKGFTALEYQQDRERVPLNNNAVLYEDDLEITPGAGIRLNGRVFTNANLLTRTKGTAVRFYLVSSSASCYYLEENNKILVAGNVVNSRVNEPDANGTNDVVVDLFYKKGTRPTNPDPDQRSINDTNKTVLQTVYGPTAAYNDEAYARRIDRLVTAATALGTQTVTGSFPSQTITSSPDPDEVKDEVKQQINSDDSLNPDTVRAEQLRIYFKKRTRRVPFAEVAFGGNALGAYDTGNPLLGSGNSLRPVNEWVFPYDPSNGTTQGGYANLQIKDNGNKLYLPATDPQTQTVNGYEERLGDRVLVGNNLPQLWYDSGSGRFVGSEGQAISGKEWDNNTNPRRRYPQASQLDNLGITDRDDFWEKSAAQEPQGILDVVGGLRVVTGAGIYLPKDYTPASTSADFNTALNAVSGITNKAWSDAMPMGASTVTDGLPSNSTPYLQMRATAVYHYSSDSYDPETPSNYQTPIACVSSFYDPTSSTTADNLSTLPLRPAAGGKSNNGIVYGPPPTASTGYEAVLSYQAQLKYPDGRPVNQPLAEALANTGDLTLSQQSAVDSALCALKILEAPTSNYSTVIPNDAIRETAFLDARQLKSIEKSSSLKPQTRNYDRSIELRQPLEIRATVLDLNLLRGKSIGTGEFLLPNSGIIYATRDDALPDASSTTSEDVSATDFKLDPTRRLSGIMLINGSNLSRNTTYKPEEKGLTLATNLPVYIQGDFNRHFQQEFTNNLATDWGNFYRRAVNDGGQLNQNFACRPNQFSGCTTGDSWRSATVIADAITILSNNFRLGFRNEGDYDLGDNAGNVRRGDNKFGITTIDERLVSFDVNGNGTITDAAVSDMNEVDMGIDLNNDGDSTDPAVTITSSGLTATLAARLNGFWENNFVTSHDFTDSQYSGATTGATNSSYFNNFVTPVQRRVQFREYVMEMCRKVTVAACGPNDWVVGYDANSDNKIDWTLPSENIKASAIPLVLPNGDPNYTVARLGAGTTARSSLNQEDRRYPRRVAFLRDTGNALQFQASQPIPLGINNTERVVSTPYDTFNTTKPRLSNNALWFKTDKNNTDDYGHNHPLKVLNSSQLAANPTARTAQPLLVPVLQLQYPSLSSQDSVGNINDTADVKLTTNWLPAASQTETNLVFAQGNTPGRPNESNGGLENFVRYLERWQGITHTASGAFIQFKRSAYATAPWQTLTGTVTNTGGEALTGIYNTSTGTIFGYPQYYSLSVTDPSSGKGQSSYYTPPDRRWGYDVALLTQLPDLFSQRFTSPPTGEPNEFYREVGRDDSWVSTLLCAAQRDTVDGNFGAADAAAYGSGYRYAIPVDQRPTTCPN